MILRCSHFDFAADLILIYLSRQFLNALHIGSERRWSFAVVICGGHDHRAHIATPFSFIEFKPHLSSARDSLRTEGRMASLSLGGFRALHFQLR